MIVTPGPFSPSVTQWVPKAEADWADDGYGGKTVTFNSRTLRVVADYPGDTVEADNAAGDEVTADRVLLLPAGTAATALDEWTASDGLRYRVDGAPGLYVNPHTGTRLIRVPLRRIS